MTERNLNHLTCRSQSSLCFINILHLLVSQRNVKLLSTQHFLQGIDIGLDYFRSRTMLKGHLIKVMHRLLHPERQLTIINIQLDRFEIWRDWVRARLVAQGDFQFSSHNIACLVGSSTLVLRVFYILMGLLQCLLKLARKLNRVSWLILFFIFKKFDLSQDQSVL